MPKRTATIAPSDLELEKEDNSSEHEANQGAKEVLALDDLRSLIYLGKLMKTVKIGGFSFEISTLSTTEQRDIMSNIMSEGDATQRMLDVKPLTMAYSVRSVNGVPLEELCADETIKNVVDKRIDVMMNMQSVVLEKLYQEYDALVTRSGKDIGIDDLKG